VKTWTIKIVSFCDIFRWRFLTFSEPFEIDEILCHSGQPYVRPYDMQTDRRTDGEMFNVSCWIHVTIIIIRRNRSCSASDFAYSCTFLRGVVSLSVCRLSHSCQMGSLTPRKGRFVVEPQSKHAAASCSQTVSPMLPPGEYKRGVEWNCHSDSTFCQITLVLLSMYICHSKSVKSGISWNH